MNYLRWFAVVLTVFIATLLQPIFFTRLNLPGSTPDLILVFVCAWAIAKGPMVGATAGFLAGVMIDLIPPTEPVLGLNSFSLVIVGFLVGKLGVAPSKSFFRPIAITMGASLILIILRAGLITIFDSQVAFSRVGELLITQAIYVGILAVFVLPLVAWLDRKLGPTTRADELRI
jgi:rod shape-determining protein MreD